MGAELIGILSVGVALGGVILRIEGGCVTWIADSLVKRECRKRRNA